MDPQFTTAAIAGGVALVVALGGRVLSLVLGKGGSGSQAQADSRGVNVEVGSSGGAEHCSVEVQILLHRLADVQEQQTRLLEAMKDESKWARKALMTLAGERLPPFEG